MWLCIDFFFFHTTETVLGLSFMLVKVNLGMCTMSTKFCYSSSQGPFRLESGVAFVILSVLCDIGLIYSHYLSLGNALSLMVSGLKER